MITDEKIFEIVNDVKHALIDENEKNNNNSYALSYAIQSILLVYGLNTKICKIKISYQKEIKNQFYLMMSDNRIIDAAIDQYPEVKQTHPNRILIGDIPMEYKMWDVNKVKAEVLQLGNIKAKSNVFSIGTVSADENTVVKLF